MPTTPLLWYQILAVLSNRCPAVNRISWKDVWIAWTLLFHKVLWSLLLVPQLSLLFRYISDCKLIKILVLWFFFSVDLGSNQRLYAGKNDSTNQVIAGSQTLSASTKSGHFQFHHRKAMLRRLQATRKVRHLERTSDLLLCRKTIKELAFDHNENLVLISGRLILYNHLCSI